MRHWLIIVGLAIACSSASPSDDNVGGRTHHHQADPKVAELVVTVSELEDEVAELRARISSLEVRAGDRKVFFGR